MLFTKFARAAYRTGPSEDFTSEAHLLCQNFQILKGGGLTRLGSFYVNPLGGFQKFLEFPERMEGGSLEGGGD